jgi:hypothetical protein
LIVNIVLTAVLFVGVLRVASQTAPTRPTNQQQTTVNSGFSYQGYITKDGVPVDGTCAMGFSLWDSATIGSGMLFGNQTETLSVELGQYETVLNPSEEFGALYGDNYYLQVNVKCPPDDEFTTIEPRFPIRSVPFADNVKGFVYVSDDNSDSKDVRLGFGTDAPATEFHFTESFTENIGVTSLWLQADDAVPLVLWAGKDPLGGGGGMTSQDSVFVNGSPLSLSSDVTMTFSTSATERMTIDPEGDIVVSEDITITGQIHGFQIIFSESALGDPEELPILFDGNQLTSDIAYCALSKMGANPNGGYCDVRLVDEAWFIYSSSYGSCKAVCFTFGYLEE